MLHKHSSIKRYSKLPELSVQGGSSEGYAVVLAIRVGRRASSTASVKEGKCY